MISTADFRNGVRIALEGDPYFIVEFQHVKPGKGGAFIRTKLKNYKTGNVIDRTFRSGERFQEPDLEERDLQFLYASGDSYAFMDTDTFEQFSYEKKQLGENVDLLKEDTVVKVLIHQHEPIAVELPIFIELKVVEADPANPHPPGPTVRGSGEQVEIYRRPLPGRRVLCLTAAHHFGRAALLGGHVCLSD